MVGFQYPEKIGFFTTTVFYPAPTQPVDHCGSLSLRLKLAILWQLFLRCTVLFLHALCPLA